MITNPEPSNVLPPLSHKDKSIVYLGIIGIMLISWFYLLNMAGPHSRMDMTMMSMPHSDPSDGRSLYDFFMLFLMWSVMMVAMMLPSILPATMVFAALNLRKKSQAQPHVQTYIFVIGYLLTWSICSLLFALAQSGLSATGALDHAMRTNNPLLSGGILLLAGIYQWTPLKEACLKHCRVPLGFFLGRWRTGYWGAVYMGWCYGLFCVGCCWALMAVMFAVGTMNVLWMAILAIFILCEKIFPPGLLIRNIAGIILVCWGSYLLLS